MWHAVELDVLSRSIHGKIDQSALPYDQGLLSRPYVANANVRLAAPEVEHLVGGEEMNIEARVGLPKLPHRRDDQVWCEPSWYRDAHRAFRRTIRIAHGRDELFDGLFHSLRCGSRRFARGRKLVSVGAPLQQRDAELAFDGSDTATDSRLVEPQCF